MQWIALLVQDTNGLHCAWQARLDATSDRGDRMIGQHKALLLGWDQHPQQFTHASNPVELIAPIEAQEISRCLTISFLPFLETLETIRWARVHASWVPPSSLTKHSPTRPCH